MTDAQERAVRRHMTAWARVARFVPLLALILAATSSGMTGVLLKLNSDRRHDQIVAAASLLKRQNAAQAAILASQCKSIHKIVVVGGQVIVGQTTTNLHNRLRLHLITPDQYRQGIEATSRALRLWRSADCQHVK